MTDKPLFETRKPAASAFEAFTQPRAGKLPKTAGQSSHRTQPPEAPGRSVTKPDTAVPWSRPLTERQAAKVYGNGMESKLHDDIREYLKTCARPGLYFRRLNPAPGMSVGMPDWVIVFAGRVLWLEGKAGRYQATAVQLNEHRLLRAAGAGVFIVRSLAEAVDAVRRFYGATSVSSAGTLRIANGGDLQEDESDRIMQADAAEMMRAVATDGDGSGSIARWIDGRKD